MKKAIPLSYFIGIAILIVAIMFGYGLYKKATSLEPKVEVSHQSIVQEIKTMGKMELVTLSVKDIVEYKITRRLLPDSKVLLQVSGEINACIDLQKLQDADVELKETSMTIYLPAPEICFTKVDHENSKIHDKTSWVLLDDDAELIENTYKEADKHLKTPELTNKAIQTAIEKAPEILAPIFKRLSGKDSVEVKFRKTPVVG